MIIDTSISHPTSSSSSGTYTVPQDAVLNIHYWSDSLSDSGNVSINGILYGVVSRSTSIDITGEPCKAGTKISVNKGSARISGFTVE